MSALPDELCSMDGSRAARAPVAVPVPVPVGVAPQSLTSTQQPKTIIRKFTPIDIKKLQGSGLDRKLAEALSKTFFANRSGVGTGTNTTSAVPSTISAVSARPDPVIAQARAATTNTTTTTSKTSSANAPPSISRPGCNPITHSKRVAKPKITITAPCDVWPPKVEQEAISQIKSNASDRLALAKRILNSKLMKKKSKQMLQIPKQKTPISRSEPSHQQPSVSGQSRATYVDVPKANAKTTVTSQQTSTEVAAIARPQPHDIAKVLNFGTKSSNTMPKPNRVVLKTPPVVLNFSLSYPAKRKADTQKTRSHGLLGKQSKMQKSRTGTLHTTNSGNIECYIETPETGTDGTLCTLKRVERNMEPKEGSIAFPEVSPLKHPFPSTNYTKAAPLPTISTFKKPGVHTVLQPVDDKISETYREMETSSGAVIVKPVQNLIVLENKVLSAEEKIDITALRLPKPIDNTSTDETSDFLRGTTSTDLTQELSINLRLDKEKNVQSNTASSANLLLPSKTVISAETLKLSPSKLSALAKMVVLNFGKSAHDEKPPTSSSASVKISQIEFKKSRAAKTTPVGRKAKSIVASTSSRNIGTTAINKTRARVVLSGNKESQTWENHATMESRTTMKPKADTYRIDNSSLNISKSGGATLIYDNVECETNGVDFLTSIMDFLNTTKTSPIESNLDMKKGQLKSYQKRKIEAHVPPDEKESDQFDPPKGVVPKDQIHMSCNAQDDKGNPGDAIVEVIEYQEEEIETISQHCDINNINLIDSNIDLCQENIQTGSSGQVSVINDNTNFITTSNFVASTTIPCKKDQLEADSNQYRENKSTLSYIQSEPTKNEDNEINTSDGLDELPREMPGLSIFHRNQNIIYETQEWHGSDNNELAPSYTGSAHSKNSNADTDLSEQGSGNSIQDTIESDETSTSSFEPLQREIPDVNDEENSLMLSQTQGLKKRSKLVHEECFDRFLKTIDSDIIESDLSSTGDNAEFRGFAETSLTDETKMNQLNQLITASNLQTSTGRSESRSASAADQRPTSPVSMRQETVANRTPSSRAMPLKKRWASQETDISDDTSPADDDEELKIDNKTKKIKVSLKTYAINRTQMVKNRKMGLSTIVDETEETVCQAPESNENCRLKGKPATTPNADGSLGQIEETSDDTVVSSKIASQKNVIASEARADDDEQPCCSKSIPKTRAYNFKKQENNPEPLPVVEKPPKMELTSGATSLSRAKRGRKNIKVRLLSIPDQIEKSVGEALENNKNYGHNGKPATAPTADESVGEVEEISDAVIDSSKSASQNHVTVAEPRAEDDEKPCCSESVSKTRAYNLKNQDNNLEPLPLVEKTPEMELTPRTKRGGKKIKARLAKIVDETEETVGQATESYEHKGKPTTTKTADESVGEVEEISDAVIDSSKSASQNHVTVAEPRAEDDEKPCCSESVSKTRAHNLKNQENNPEPLPVVEKIPEMELTPRTKRGGKKIKARLAKIVDETEETVGQALESNEHKRKPATTLTADESVGEVEEIINADIDSSKIASQKNVTVAEPRAEDDEKPWSSKSVSKTRAYNLKKQENNPEPLPVVEKIPEMELTPRTKRGGKKIKARLAKIVDETEETVGQATESYEHKGKPTTTKTADESVGEVEEISDAVIDSSKSASQNHVTVAKPRAEDDEKPCCSKSVSKTRAHNLKNQENNPEPLPVVEKIPEMELTPRTKRGGKKIKARLAKIVDETEETVGQALESNEHKRKPATTLTADESVGEVEEIIDADIDSSKIASQKNVTVAEPRAEDDEKPWCSKSVSKTRAYNLKKQENIPEPLPVVEKTPEMELTPRTKRGGKKIKARLAKIVDETEETVGQAPESNENSRHKVKPATTPTADESVGQIEETIDGDIDSSKSASKKNVIVSEPRADDDEQPCNSELLPLVDKTPNTVLPPSEAPLAKKKRGRKPKNKFVETIEESTKEEPGGKRQRVEVPFNSRMLLIRKRDQMESDEPLTVTAGTGPLQCGLCLARTTADKWTQHLSEHYGIGWIKGEPALNVESRSVVLSTMTNFYKDTAIKALPCRLCKRLYRSALGLLQHLENCGAAKIRFDCNMCGRNYTKLSLPYHMRTCNARQESDDQTGEKSATDDASEPVLNNFGRAKRRSLLRAETKVKATAAELVNTDVMTDDFDPKAHIKYQKADTNDHHSKWRRDMERFGMAFCPYKQCKFNVSDLTEIQGHLSSCKFKPKEGYYCMFCKRAPPLASEAAAIKHIYKRHKTSAGCDFEGDGSNYEITSNDECSGSDDDISSDPASSYESDEESVSPGSKKKNRVRSLQSTNAGENKVRVYPQRGNYKEVASKKWKDIMAKHYTESALYSNVMPMFKLETSYTAVNAPTEFADTAGDTSEDESIVPVVDSNLSMKFIYRGKSTFKNCIKSMVAPVDEWEQLKLYEQKGEGNDRFIYVDAPVKKLAWAPMPRDIKDQYLVVVCREKIGKYTRCRHPKLKPTRLLVLKVTRDDRTAAMTNVQLHYAVRIPIGPVHCVAFMPSGGYDKQTNRLGLLAVGGAAGTTINIYALPLDVAEKVAQQASGTTLAIDMQPSMVLLLDVPSSTLDLKGNRLIDSQCLSVAWSEALPCNHIFAGFSNGFVGIWDIEDIDDDDCSNSDSSSEPTLSDCTIVNGMTNYMAIKYFYTGERSARGLALHYDDNGARWLAVALLSRRLVIYDMKNFADPIIVKEILVTNILRDMHWPTIWEAILTAHCDLVPNNWRAVIANSSLGLIYNACKIVGAQGAVSQVHYNPALAQMVMATDNGDVIFEKVRELHLEEILPSRTNIERSVAMMNVRCLITDDEMPKIIPEGLTLRCDPEYKTKYGLVFTPVMVMHRKDNGVYQNPKRITSSGLTLYTRVNSLLCNLNPSGYRLTAIGYENGLLRIVNFKRSEQKSIHGRLTRNLTDSN